MTSLFVKLFIKNHCNQTDPTVRAAYGKLAGIIGIICNMLLFALKIVVAIITSSVAIGADAVNNLSDASSSIISLIGFKLSEKPADAKHPYGHGRYEYISALCVAVIVIFIGFELFKTSVDKILNPQKVAFTITSAVIIIVSVILKYWMMVFNKKCGKTINSNALSATATDCRNDCIISIAILIGAVISYYTGYELDGWLGLGVSVFILISGIKLIKDTLDPLIGSVPDMEYMLRIKNKILSYPRVLGIHDLIIHDYGPSRKFASVHVEMSGEDDVYENHEIIDNIETYFLNKEGLNIIIHYDPIVTNDPMYAKMREILEKTVTDINPDLSIHDFRIAKKDECTDLIFDCVLPQNVMIDKAELIAMIQNKVKKIDNSYNCVIIIDENYPHA